MADKINKPLIDPAEQDVLMREMFRGTPQPTISPARMDPIPMTRPTTGPITQPNVNPMPVNFGGQNIPPVPRTGPITGGITQPGINPMPINLGGQNISPRGPIPRMQEGGPVQEGGMPMPPGGMPTGETANAGIMEGFNNPEGQAIAEKIATDFNSIRNHEDVMNMIRGDEKTVDERKDELADIVGEEDAEATPDSSLTITQFGMKQITEANQQLEQGEEPGGIAGLPEGQEAIDMDQGALMGAQPEVPQVPETVMPGMAFGGMVQGYAYGGEVTKEGIPVQRGALGLLAAAPWAARIGLSTPGGRWLTKKAAQRFAKPFVKTVGKGKKSKTIETWGKPQKEVSKILEKEAAGKSKMFGGTGITKTQAVHRTGWFAGLPAYGAVKTLGGDKDKKSVDLELGGSEDIPNVPVLPHLTQNKIEKKTVANMESEHGIMLKNGLNPLEEYKNRDEKGYKELIKSATIEDAKENVALFKEIMKPNTDYYRRQAWFQLAQFGMNLASSKGGQSLTSAIATSAKEPMAAVAALGAEKHKEERDIATFAAQKAIDHKYKIEEIRTEQILKGVYDKSNKGQYMQEWELVEQKMLPATPDPNDSRYVFLDETGERITTQEHSRRIKDQVEEDDPIRKQVLDHAEKIKGKFGGNSLAIADLVVRGYKGKKVTEKQAKAIIEGKVVDLEKKEDKPVQEQINNAIAAGDSKEEIRDAIRIKNLDPNDYTYGRE